MKLNELLLAEYDREVARSRKALEQMPEGKKEWKPHDKSLQFGYVCEMVATIPTCVK
jgi:DNA topoisomerase VI subunit B